VFRDKKDVIGEIILDESVFFGDFNDSEISASENRSNNIEMS